MNTSVNNHNKSVDIGQMSLRELRKEDQVMLDDLTD